VVGLVSHYQSNPRPAHWQAIKRIMHYLCGTTNLVLCYQGWGARKHISKRTWNVFEWVISTP